MAFPSAEDIVKHSHSLQFVVALKEHAGSGSDNSQNALLLSDVFDKLHKFCSDRNVTFNVSQSLLDRAFDQLLTRDNDDEGNGTAAATS